MIDPRTAPYAALVLRLALGTMFIAHGLLKLLVFTPAGTVGYFESLGLPGPLAYLTMVAEIGGWPVSAAWRRQSLGGTGTDPLVGRNRGSSARRQWLAVRESGRWLGVSGVLDSRRRSASVAGRWRPRTTLAT